MIEGVLANTLAGVSEIKAALASYNGQPAIFTAGIPQDAGRPALTICCTASRDFSVRARAGAELQADVIIHGDRANFSRTSLRALAWKVYAAMNRSELSPYLDQAGYENHGCSAEAPIDRDGRDGFPECVVKVTVRTLVKPG
jgi:hypothetical protein